MVQMISCTSDMKIIDFRGYGKLKMIGYEEEFDR